jgi:hypothetical protein
MKNTTEAARRPRKISKPTQEHEKRLVGFHQRPNQKMLPSRSGKTGKVITRSPEGGIIEIRVIKMFIGKVSTEWGLIIPRYYPDNYNSFGYTHNTKDLLPKKFMGKKVVIPEPLPLPTEWRKLLPEKVTAEIFFFDYENDWVHTHFCNLYEVDKYKKRGSVFIEPSEDGKKVFFIGTAEYACHYFLELDN